MMMLKYANLLVFFYHKKVSEICNEGDIGLYRDDGWAIFRNKSSTQLDKNKKEIPKII